MFGADSNRVDNICCAHGQPLDDYCWLRSARLCVLEGGRIKRHFRKLAVAAPVSTQNQMTKKHLTEKKAWMLITFCHIRGIRRQWLELKAGKETPR